MRYRSRTREKEVFLKRVKIYGIVGSVLLLVIGFFSFLFHFPLFSVEKILVSGNSSVSSAAIIAAVDSQIIEKSSFNHWLGLTNILSWGGSPRATAAALKYLPSVAGLKIERDIFSRQVIIKVNERPKTLLWCVTASGSCYWVDQNGTAFLRSNLTTTSTASSTTPLVVDSSRPNIILLGRVLDSSRYGNLLQIVAFLNNLGFKNPEIYLENLNYDEVRFKTPDGKEIYFSLLFNPADDFGAVKSIFQDPALKSNQYKDLIVQGRIYYK